MKVIELFAGIGSQTQALKNIGVEHEVVGIAEIDKYAVKSYEAIHGEVNNLGDICKIGMLPQCDLLTYSFPCQDISVAGKGAGIKEGTRSGLLLEVERLLEASDKPKYLLMENVKNLVGKKNKPDFDRWCEKLESIGYANYWKILNAKHYGIPQNRERVFMVSILGEHEPYGFPEGFDNGIRLKDLLEDEVDEKFYISGEKVERLIATLKEPLKAGGIKVSRKGEVYEGRTEIASTLMARDYKGLDNTVKTAVAIPCLTPDRVEKRQNGRRFKEDGEPMFTLTGQDRHGVLVKQATKQGFAIAHEYDSINLEQPNSKTRRGRVGRQMANTLTCGCNQAVVVVKPRKDIKELEKHCEYCGEKLERKRFNGRLEDFGVFNNRKYCDRECMRRAFVMVGENGQSWSTAHATARKINELFLQKDSCEICGGTQNLDIHHIDGNWQNNELRNLMCLCRSCHTKYEKNKNKECGYRIRKLTPRETWRLMGFQDEHFQRATDAGISNSQLYKQAGNSIVVDVLEHIFMNLFK